MIVSTKQHDARHRAFDSNLRLLRITSLIALQMIFVSRPGISATERVSIHDSVGVAESQKQEKASKVALVWMDPSGSLPFGFERMAREVKRIIATAGIEISWTESDVPTGSSSERIRVIPVVLVSTNSTVWGIENNALGTVSGPASMPHVYVFLPNILRALGYPPWESHRKIPAIATALGRVAAHEVFHVLYPDEPHATEGLMMKRWNVLHLSKRQFDLSDHIMDVLLPAPSSIGSDSLSSNEIDAEEKTGPPR